MNDVLKTWGHIGIGLFWVVVGVIFAVGFATTINFAETKIREHKGKTAPVKQTGVNNGGVSSKDIERLESCRSDRDPLCDTLPALCVPKEFRIKNCASKNGMGMNCLACIETAAHYQGIATLYGLVERNMKDGGGGWPAKIGRILQKEQEDNLRDEDEGVSFCFEQYEGKDFADKIEAAIDLGRLPCVTYGDSKHGRQTMVCVLHLDHAARPARACILDPNWPDKVEWLSRSEFLKNAACNGDGTAWVVTLQK